MPAGISDDREPPEAASGGLGFCGKLRSHGDFVRRRVPDAFAGRWEEWLDAGMAASRTALGADWRSCYLTSPIWRFVASAECCGERPFAGVMMPSVDRVGRHHPLTIVALLPGGVSAVLAALAAGAWFRDVERIALSALDDDFRFDAFDAELAATASPGGAAPTSSDDRSAETATLDGEFARLIGGLTEAAGLRYSLWWAVDADERLQFCRAYGGLPPSDQFVHFLRPAPGAPVASA